MQSQYGIPEMQQFMAEGGCSSIFSISSAEVHSPAQMQKPQHLHPHSLAYQQHLHLHHHHHHQQQQHQQMPFPPPPSLHHFQGHQLQLFQQEQQRRIHHQLVQLGLETDGAVPESSSSPARIIASLGCVDFKLGAGDSRERIHDEDAILQVDDPDEIHPNIKEPFWRPLDIDYINRRSKEKQPEIGGGACNFKLFSELEAICKPIVGHGQNPSNQQTGSGSGLTGDNPPARVAMAGDTRDQASDSSTGEEAAKLESAAVHGGAARKRKRRQRQLSSIAAFMEGLVTRLMEHQEGLHRKFLEILDRRDGERMAREEAWRQQEMARASSQAMAKAQDRALASSREAAIVFFLEKISGETLSLNLPGREQFLLEEEPPKEEPKNSSRWPKAEVQALIQVRSNLEARFQEPGLKGPLWEEVSAAMAAMGYQRSAKRCKEKWENINKYFRKTKDSAKRRSQQSKTCPYFHQLDQLYSKSPQKPPAMAGEDDRADMSELLQAVMAAGEDSRERGASPLMAEPKLPWRKRCSSEDYNHYEEEEEDDDDDDDDGDDDEEDDGEGDDEGEYGESQDGGKDPRS
ncbi:uncharacterized protein LOC144708388 [Wolffia australiana]